MGAMSRLAGIKALPGQDRGSRLWTEIFGATDKEESKQPSRPVRGDGGGWGRSLVSSAASTKRLIQALRSMAPGGWSDDRWEQTRHFVGIAYLAIHRLATQWQQSEFQVFHRDMSVPDGKVPVSENDPPQGGREVRPYDLVKLLQRPNRQDSWGKIMYRWCTPAGTLIRMADGSYQGIEKIRLMDEVLTAEGNVGKVNQCFVRDHEGEIVELKLWGHGHLRLTPNHEVLTHRGYVPAGELTKEDWVSLPRYKPVEVGVIQTALHVSGEKVRIRAASSPKCGLEDFSTSGTSWTNYKKVPDFIRLTPAFGRIVGLFLAEGHTEKTSVVWSFGSHESETLVSELVGLLRDELGLEAYTQIRNDFGTVTQVVVCGILWARMFRSLCGSRASGKRIHPDLMSGPDDFLEALFHGWIDGDGNGYREEGLVGVTVSHTLALGMFDIANHLGWRPVIRRNPPGKGRIHGRMPKTRQPVWRVVLVSSSDNYRVRLEQDRMWRRVCRIVRKPYSGKVFNFGVEGDNSYTAEGVGVHNCQQKYLTGTALTWEVPNVLGTPMEMYAIPTAIAIPQPAVNPDYPDGYYRIQPVYPYGPFSSYPTPTSAVGAAVPAQWMMRFQFPHPLLRYEGFAPLTGVRLHLDEVEMVDRSRHYSMRREIRPSAVLNFGESEGMQALPEEEIARIHAEFESEAQGPENAGRLFIATPGANLEPWGTSPMEMDYHDSWEQLVSFSLAAFGITKPAAGMIEEASYASLFAALKQLHVLTLKPDVDDVASDITQYLCPFFGDDLFVEIRCPRIDDHDIKMSKLDMAGKYKAITKNQLLKELDLPITKEEWGGDMAGDPSPKEGEVVKEQQKMEQLESLTPSPAGEGGKSPAGESSNGKLEGEREEPLEAARPSPGNLSRGALGPRMKGVQRKSFYQRTMEVISNGRR